jgi:type IX secretion system PorP/SprF family membrane protein
MLPGLISYSQQQTQFTQYMFNKTEFNPAATGSSKAICAYGTARYQWMGLKNDSSQVINPRNYLFNIELPIYSIRSGIGVSVNYGQLGVEDNFDIKLNYAYHQPIKENHILSIGFSFELLNKSIDYSQFFTFDSGDPLLNDIEKESGKFTDFGLGVYYKFKDKFYTGLSVSQLTGSSSEIGEVKYDLVPHYYFMAGYDFTLKEDRKSRFVLATGFLVKTTIDITQIELHALLRYNDRYWGGLMYRNGDAIGILAGMNYNDFSFGLSYDITISALRNAGSKGSPEVFIKYCYPINPKVKKRGYYNPRYL